MVNIIPADNEAHKDKRDIVYDIIRSEYVIDLWYIYEHSNRSLIKFMRMLGWFIHPIGRIEVSYDRTTVTIIGESKRFINIANEIERKGFKVIIDESSPISDHATCTLTMYPNLPNL